MIMTKVKIDLMKLCREWQDSLRLRDWDITISTVRYYQLADYDRLAEIVYSLPKKKAVISILDPDDWNPDDPDFDENRQDMPERIEESIVHELLHLHMAPIKEGRSDYDPAVEQAVNCLASAFVKIKNRKE
jgi:hypothetical protein